MSRRRITFSAVMVFGCLSLAAYGYQWTRQLDDADDYLSLRSAYDRLVVAGPKERNPRASIVPGKPSLAGAVKWAEDTLPRVQAIEDYSCTLIKRERVGKSLVGPHHIAMKVRNRPFSIYLKYLEPSSLRNQEVIYVEGRNGGKLLAHVNGVGRFVGTIALKPTSRLALKGNRYPVTEAGLVRLLERLIDIGQHDLQYGEDETTYTSGVMLDGRPCTVVEVRHPERREHFNFAIAKIYVDEATVLPLRFEAFTWPENAGEPPLPIEEYTYVDLNVNNGFTDLDWDPANPAYGFSSARKSKLTTAQAKSLARERLASDE